MRKRSRDISMPYGMSMEEWIKERNNLKFEKKGNEMELTKKVTVNHFNHSLFKRGTAVKLNQNSDFSDIRVSNSGTYLICCCPTPDSLRLIDSIGNTLTVYADDFVSACPSDAKPKYELTFLE